MIASFEIEYRTHWGEQVCVFGSLVELGGHPGGKPIPMETLDGIHWHLSLPVSMPTNEKSFTYHYCICRGEEIVRKEWTGHERRILLQDDVQKTYRFINSWKELPVQHPFYSSAFTKSLLAFPKRPVQAKQLAKSVQLHVMAPNIGPDKQLCISGNQKALGNWEVAKAPTLTYLEAPEWMIDIDAKQLTYPLEYKFFLKDKVTGHLTAWEAHENHYLHDPQLEDNETIVYTLDDLYFEQPQWKGAGTAVPVFSLRSEQSFGVGDFGDLKRMVDWIVQTKQHVLQILPINDTTMTHTWVDSYPYNSISIYALHPMYIDISQLPKLRDASQHTHFEEIRQKLNKNTSVDYEAVSQNKWTYFRLIFDQEGKRTFNSKRFQEWYTDNEEWLKPYAAFSYLRDCYKTPNFNEWPAYNVFKQAEIDALTDAKSDNFQDIAIYYYIQFHLHIQLVDVAKYARANGVVLKGDIPIGISRNSVEAWKEPHYFNLNGQAGAPPDDFSVKGQNWGFPTYNWKVMAEDNYAWWRKRFQKMATYFDAYRIDHILGFFRIWQIPMHCVEGLLGQFVPAIAMTPEEVEGYGLHFDYNFMTKPYIHEYFLHEVFGEYTDWVKEEFILPTNSYEIYEMREEYKTQRAVEAYFYGRTDEKSIRVRDGLYSLISDVLFVADIDDPHRFHPRIGVQNEFVFRALNGHEQAAFNRLYNNYYYHRHNDFWYKQAMKKLPTLTESTKMLVCGEDLGMIPACVPAVMEELRILSLEIQRMPKDPKQEFGYLPGYPQRSVCTISTHDMAPVRMWWKEDKEATQRYYNFELGHWGDAPEEASAEICSQIVRNHLYSNSMLCVLALQDWMAIDRHFRLQDEDAERINIPANPRHYWRYRMHLTIEQLLEASSLNNQIIELIEQTGR